jgi:hypothetical protein
VRGTPGNPRFDNIQRRFQTALNRMLLSGAVKYVLYKVCVANLEWTSLSALVLEVGIRNVTAGDERLNHVDQ